MLFICLLACNPEATQNELSDSKDDIQHEHLISAQELTHLLKAEKEQLIILHISKSEDYQKGHLPGAINIWRPQYTTSNIDSISELIIDENKLESLLQNLGVEESSQLILYDIKGNVDALRFAWVLELYGFDNFKVLNGGMKYWKQLGLPVEQDPSRKIVASNYTLESRKDFSSYAKFEEIISNLNNEDYLLIDTREVYEFEGKPFILNDKVYKHKKGSFNRGKIPGSVHLNWSELVDLTGDHRIKSIKDLHYNLHQKGIHSDKNIILYCQSGSRSSHSYFVMKHLLGFPNVKNYDGSWIEWSYLNKKKSDIPIEQICDSLNFMTLYDSLIAETTELKNQQIQDGR